jgi:diguanylate cyclase (GGDEF)-like protein
MGWGSVFKPDLFQGTLIWWVPIASVTLSVGVRVGGYMAEHGRNWLWNVMIEYIFQRKKAKLYQKALTEKNKDLERMSSQYRELAQETHSLKDSVITDELTKVFNKRFFLNRIQQEFNACKQHGSMLSLIMVDIDFFKKLNDNYGHLAGDQVLKSVAQVLKRFSPDQCYPCRYGGEEFVIIMARKTLEQTIEAARLIQENVQQLRFDDIDKKLRVTVSQGICTVDFSSPESASIKKFESLLELADQQLYRSKQEGRNRVSANYITDRHK